MNAGVLVVAGSETTATTIAAALYFLLTNPSAYDRVQTEVRSSFKSEADINIESVNKLEYMLASLNETMRMLPAVASGLPRVVPLGGRVLNGEFVPEDVSALLSKLVPSDKNRGTDYHIHMALGSLSQQRFFSGSFRVSS
jgi:hypothetical protein